MRSWFTAVDSGVVEIQWWVCGRVKLNLKKSPDDMVRLKSVSKLIGHNSVIISLILSYQILRLIT